MIAVTWRRLFPSPGWEKVRHPHLDPLPSGRGDPAGLVTRRQRLRLFELHLVTATLHHARTRLVAEHLGAAGFAQIPLAKLVCHDGPPVLSKNIDHRSPTAR